MTYSTRMKILGELRDAGIKLRTTMGEMEPEGGIASHRHQASSARVDVLSEAYHYLYTEDRSIEWLRKKAQIEMHAHESEPAEDANNFAVRDGKIAGWGDVIYYIDDHTGELEGETLNADVTVRWDGTVVDGE